MNKQNNNKKKCSERDKKYDSESERLTKREIWMVRTFAWHRQLLCCFEIWFYVIYARMGTWTFFWKVYGPTRVHYHWYCYSGTDCTRGLMVTRGTSTTGTISSSSWPFPLGQWQWVGEIERQTKRDDIRMVGTFAGHRRFFYVLTLGQMTSWQWVMSNDK